MKANYFKITLVVLAAGIIGFAIAYTSGTKAEVTPRLDPESGAATCPAGFGLEDFESGTDGYYGGGGPVVSTIPGVEFTTTDGKDWLIGDWGDGSSWRYNGKYPLGAYTSGGQKWSWLGTAQGSGIIDFTDEKASYVSVYTSTYSGLVLEAYADDGTFLESSNWADRNIRTGTMTQLSITRPTADIGYVIVHDTGNFWLIDWLCVSKGASSDVTVQEVDIDIKPGSDPNSVNTKSKGNVPVALLGSESFDVATVDSNSVVFDHAPVDKVGKKTEDVNDDGYLDLVFHFKTQSLWLVNTQPVSFPASTEACLEGSTSDDVRFKGCDSVRIVR